MTLATSYIPIQKENFTFDRIAAMCRESDGIKFETFSEKSVLGDWRPVSGGSPPYKDSYRITDGTNDLLLTFNEEGVLTAANSYATTDVEGLLNFLGGIDLFDVDDSYDHEYGDDEDDTTRSYPLEPSDAEESKVNRLVNSLLHG